MPNFNSRVLSETSRLAAVHHLQILDSLPEQSFSDIALLASHVCRTPIAQVVFIDSDRQWVKATVGIEACDVARSDSFCAHTIPTATALVVRDAKQDPRFKDNPLVLGFPHISAYAGSPIIDDREHVLGTVCVIDTVPRDFSSSQIEALDALARHTNLLLKQRAMLTAQESESAKEIRASQQSLAATAERLALSQAAGRIASWEWELGTNRLTWSGSQWAYGRPPVELATLEQVWPLIHPEDVPKVMHALKPVMSGKGDYNFQFRAFWPDGSMHWLQAFGKPVFSSSGQVERIFGMHMDITAKKTAEERLLQTEKIATVGRLSSVIAHELNNPLASLANLLFLAKESSSLDEVRDLLDFARAELERATAIASQTLRFHKHSSEKHEVYLPTLLDGVLLLQRSRLSSAGITLERRDRVKEHISCFESEIRQVLANLIVNALDAFTPGERRLLLRTRPATDWRTHQKGQVITVADTGTGMSKGVLRQVFDAFFTTKELCGTGLGLWVSKEIIERHDGRILVRSSEAPGKSGTVFTIFLPNK